MRIGDTQLYWPSFTIWLRYLGAMGAAEWAAWAQALGTIAALWFTVAAAERQVRGSQRIAREDRRRRERAARAVLPLTLSAIISFAQELALISDRLSGPANEDILTGEVDAPDLPTWPAAAVSDIRAAIEVSDNGPVEAALTHLLALLQIHQARMVAAQVALREGLWSVTKTEAVGYTVDAAELVARCASLFPYARGQSELPREPWDSHERIINALHELGFFEAQHAAVFAKAGSRFPSA